MQPLITSFAHWLSAQPAYCMQLRPPAMQPAGDASINTHEGNQTSSSSRPGHASQATKTAATKTAAASEQPTGAHVLCPLRIALSYSAASVRLKIGPCRPALCHMPGGACFKMLELSRLCKPHHTKSSPVLHNKPTQTQPAAAACQTAPLQPGPLHSNQVSH